MLELQRKLLGDPIRNSAFYKALKRMVTTKSVVLDIGSGTGFLSFLAERLGAKECWLVESGDVATLAEEIAALNGIKRCTFVHGHSADIPLPKADVIVSETLGNYALEEGIIDTLSEAKRYLKKGGTMIPSSLRQFACPVVTPRIQKSIDIWNVGFGLDLSPARQISLQNLYVKTLRPSDLLSGGRAGKQWDTLDFLADNANVREARLAWRLPRKTRIAGMALWWEATLVPGVTLSTSPLGKPTHWEQIYIPFADAVTCEKGDTLHLHLRSDTSREVGLHVTWTYHLVRKDGTATEPTVMDTMKGLL